MRLFLLIAAAVLLGGALVGELIVQDPGYVLLSYGQTTVETSIWGLALVTLIGFILLHLTLRLLAYLFSRRRKLGRWRRDYSRSRAIKATGRGLRALARADWSKAQRLLDDAAKDSELPLVNYLAAAEAAEALNQHEACDAHLQTARRRLPGAELAVTLMQARIQSRRGQFEEAQALLRQQQQKHPRHPQVLRMLAASLQALEDWNGLAQLVPTLRRHAAMDEKELDELEQRTYHAWIDCAPDRLPQGTASSERLEAVRQVWNGLPKRLKRAPEMVQAYAERLASLDAFDEAAQAMRAYLKKNPVSDQDPSNELVALLGRLPETDSRRSLKMAREWQAESPDNPILLLTLGRLAMRNREWQEARGYFENSLAIRPTPDAFAELCRLLLSLRDEAGYQHLSGELQRQAGIIPGLPALPLPLPAQADTPSDSQESTETGNQPQRAEEEEMAVRGA